MNSLSTCCLIGVVAVLLSCCASPADAHFRLVSPTPRPGCDSCKASYPCGGTAFGSGTKTTYAPGPRTFRWEEFINHNGAPFAIMLAYGNDNQRVMLYDHIPHNDVASSSKFYEFVVDIPDINCPNCAIQMYNPMTDKPTTIAPNGCCCYPSPAGDAGWCESVYLGCADISITGTADPAIWASTYTYTGPTGYYTQESVAWAATGATNTYSLSNQINDYGPAELAKCNNTCAAASNTVTSTVTGSNTGANTGAANNDPSAASSVASSIALALALVAILVC